MMIWTRHLHLPKRCRDGRGALPDFEKVRAHTRRGDTRVMTAVSPIPLQPMRGS